MKPVTDMTDAELDAEYEAVTPITRDSGARAREVWFEKGVRMIVSNSNLHVGLGIVADGDPSVITRTLSPQTVAIVIHTACKQLAELVSARLIRAGKGSVYEEAEKRIEAAIDEQPTDGFTDGLSGLFGGKGECDA